MGKKDKTSLQSFYTLFVKFSKRIPNPITIQDEVRSIYSNVLNVRKPRQKSARWVLVDFETEELALEFKKILEEKKNIAKIPVKVNKLNLRQNGVSSTDNDMKDTVNTLSKKLFSSKAIEKYSNQLLVTNLPASITFQEVKDLFPGHLKIDLRFKPKARAIVTYSSAKEALDIRMSLKDVIAKEKYRVIVMLLNYQKKKNNSDTKIKDDDEGEPEVKKGRYFENTIE